MKSQKFYRVNEKIRFSPVVLVDDKGENLGSISLFKAKEIAKNKNLDLVEVSPNSRPPVCKIMDFGKFKYDQKVKEKKQKQLSKQSQLKEIRLSSRIEHHDLETKLKKVFDFLDSGHKVQIKLEFKKRENNHKEIGQNLLNKFLSNIPEEKAKTVKSPFLEGRFLSCLIEPIK